MDLADLVSGEDEEDSDEVIIGLGVDDADTDASPDEGHEAEPAGRRRPANQPPRTASSRR